MKQSCPNAQPNGRADDAAQGTMTNQERNIPSRQHLHAHNAKRTPRHHRPDANVYHQDGNKLPNLILTETTYQRT